MEKDRDYIIRTLVGTRQYHLLRRPILEGIPERILVAVRGRLPPVETGSHDIVSDFYTTFI